MITFSERTQSEGRNGMMITTAIDVHKTIWNDGKTVTLTPVTSKGHRGRCFIEIPTADLPQLIEELKAQLK